MAHVNFLARTTSKKVYGFHSTKNRPPTTAENNSAPRQLNPYTAFRIREIVRVIGPNGYNRVWVRSEVGHWYQYYEGMFTCAEPSPARSFTNPVRIWPHRAPEYQHLGDPHGPRPSNGSMYTGRNSGAFTMECDHILPYV